MVKTVKRLVKALAAIVGYEVENDVQIQHTLFTNVLKKIYGSTYTDIIKELVNERFIQFTKFGKGLRVVIKKDPEYESIKNYIFTTQENISIEEFEKLFNYYIEKLKNPITGYVDLGEIKKIMLKFEGISEDLFDKYVKEILKRRRNKYILLHGGSYRIKIGDIYVGMIKCVSR